VPSGKEVQSLEGGTYQFGGSLALSRDGRYVAVTSGDRVNSGWLALWQVDGGKEVLKLARINESYSVVTFSPDGSLMAAVVLGPRREATVRFWDTRTGAEIPLLQGEGPSLLGRLLAISPDGRTLARVAANSPVPAGPGDPGWKVQLCELASGKVRAEFSGHRGRIFALAFSPDGRTLATGGADTTVLLWDVTGRVGLDLKDKLTREELNALWEELADNDARKAPRALARLAAAPADAVNLIKQQLPPAAGKVLERQQVDALIADLGAEDFEKRQAAQRALQEAGKQVLPALVRAKEANPPLETARRLQVLIDALTRPSWPPEMIRPTRALELLERLDTPEARGVLEELAHGHPGARLTEDARAMLERLQQKR
jgi:hypothetical protein